MTVSLGEIDDVEREDAIDDIDAFDYAMMALEIGKLDDRKISFERRAEFYTDLQRRVQDLFRKDEIFRELIGKLVRQGQAGWFLRKYEEDSKIGKMRIRPLSLTKSIGKFWKKYKVPILIGAGVVSAIAGVVIVVTICSASAAAAAANDPGKSDKTPSPKPPSPPEPPKETATVTEVPSAPVPPSVIQAPSVPIAPPLPPFLMNTNVTPEGLWINSEFYPYLSDLKGADLQFIRNLPIEFRQNLAIHSAENRTFIASASVPNNVVSHQPPVPPPARPVVISPHQGRFRNALHLIGRGIIDSPELFDPTPLVVEPAISLGEVLETIGRGIIDNPELLDPTPLVIEPSSAPPFFSEALKIIGEGVIDSPQLLDPTPLFFEPSSTSPFFGDALKIIGEGVIDSPWLIDPNGALPVKPPTSFNTSVIKTMPDYYRIGMINGMNTSEEEKNSHVEYIAKFASEVSMDGVYNRTHGPIIDITESIVCNLVGISPITADLLIANWTAFHEKYKDQPGMKYLQICHSQGAFHTNNALESLPKEIRDRIIVVAIAPGTIVSTSLCYKSFNYACKSDIVPYSRIAAAVFGIGSLKRAVALHRELILLDAPEGSTGLNHDFQNSVYKDVIEKRIEEYLRKNGNYQ